MHDARHGTVDRIADRVRPLVRRLIPFRSPRHELERDRVLRVGRIDQRRHGGRHCDRVALRHLGQHGIRPRRKKPRGPEVVEAAERPRHDRGSSGVLARGSRPATTGPARWSARPRPASPGDRSRARCRSPPACWQERRGNPRRSDKAPGRDRAAPPWRPRTGGAVRRHPSVRRSRWRFRRRRHRARSAPPASGRRGSVAPGRLPAPDRGRALSAGRARDAVRPGPTGCG